MEHTFANGDNDRQRQWMDTEPTKRHKYCAIILINNNIGAESEKKIKLFLEKTELMDAPDDQTDTLHGLLGRAD